MHVYLIINVRPIHDTHLQGKLPNNIIAFSPILCPALVSIVDIDVCYVNLQPLGLLITYRPLLILKIPQHANNILHFKLMFYIIYHICGVYFLCIIQKHIWYWVSVHGIIHVQYIGIYIENGLLPILNGRHNTSENQKVLILG